MKFGRFRFRLPALARFAAVALVVALAAPALAAGPNDAKPYYLGASQPVDGFDPARAFLPVDRHPLARVPLTQPVVAKFLGLPGDYKAERVTVDPLTIPLRKQVYDYLATSPEAVDSARLRMRARAIAGAVAKRAGDHELAAFYAEHRLAPIATVIQHACNKGMSATIRPVEVANGPGTRTLVSYIHVKNSGMRGPVDVSLPARMKNDTLDLAFLHENAHGIMYDLYGSRFAAIPRPSDNGHDGPVISDRGLAWIEGWAEAFEALYGPANPLIAQGRIDPAKYGLAEFQLTRQDPVRREAYMWDPDAAKRSGLLKTGAQIIATEGAVAGIVYDLLVSRAIDDPYSKLCVVMASGKPQDIVEVIRGLMAAYPNDAQTVARIFLENTRYATVCNEARKLYNAYYTAKKAYVQKKIDQAAYHRARDGYTRHKEALFARVMADPKLLSANVGPDLWVKMPLVPRPAPAAAPSAPSRPAAKACECPDCTAAAQATAGKPAPAPAEKLQPINLNSARPGFLMRVGFTRDQAEELAMIRSAAGFLTAKQANELLTRYGLADKVHKAAKE